MAFRSAHRGVFRLVVIASIVVAVALLVALRQQLANRDAAAVTAVGAAQVEAILGPSDFASMGGDPGSEFGVTAGQAIVFSAGGVLRVDNSIHSAWPRATKVEIAGTQPESFALDADGPMLGIAGGYFGVLNPDGQMTKSIPMPFDGMRLAPSIHPGAVYLFGGARDDYRLYRFIEDGTLQIVLESDEPIVSVADNQQSIFAATARQVMRIEAGSPRILFTAPSDGFDGPIRSVAVTEDGLVLFSTDARVYAMMGPNALSIVNDAGGSLRVRDGVLYVLDPNRKILFSLKPASVQLLSEAANE